MPKKYKISYTSQAQEDLYRIVDGILSVAWARSADKWAAKILNKVESLSVFPERNLRYEYDETCRSVRIGKYRIIYEVFDDEKVVIVLRIVYARRNLREMRMK